jgi:hypothetical protein
MKLTAKNFACIVVWFVGCACANAATNYSDRVLFENSSSQKAHYYSSTKISFPSSLAVIDRKLPVDTEHFLSAPNSLKLQWTSRVNGGWEAEVHAYIWRNRVIDFRGTELRLHVYSPTGIAAADLPLLALQDVDGNFTRTVTLATFTGDLPAGEWRVIRVPTARLEAASVREFHSAKTKSVIFVQGRPDEREHTLFVDDITFDSPRGRSVLQPVTGVRAEGFERHIDIAWNASKDLTFARYEIFRSIDGGPFQQIGTQMPTISRYADYVGRVGVHAKYKVRVMGTEENPSAFSAVAEASTKTMTDDELLTMVQQASFRYYWELAQPDSGMARENVPGNDDIVATGASGFGIMALVVGADRGFVTRRQAIERLLLITSFLSRADRFHGAWPHFLNGRTGRTMPVFDQFDDGGDLVETSFLMEGLLAARQYFKNDGVTGQDLYHKITQLWEGVEWDWYRRTPPQDALFWHWSPDYTWYISNRLTGWNETMITYLLAIASPTHGVPGSLFYSGFAAEGVKGHYANGKRIYGIELPVGEGVGGPLFFAHYSFMGFDPRKVRDKYANYFEQNRAMAQINEAYCVKNPRHFAGYGADDWGITAVDGPQGYVPYEPNPELDDGTIAPTGAVASMPYMPDAAMRALKHFYRDLGGQLWGEYGFRDAFNQQQDWTAGIYMGLNQAPQVVMIENYRTALVWKNFIANPEVPGMLERAGFKPDPK